MDEQELRKRIEVRAYELYEWYRDEGYPNDPMRDWLEAKSEILDKIKHAMEFPRRFIMEFNS